MAFIKYTNEHGQSVEMGQDTPYKIVLVEGESAVQNIITSAKTYKQDGESVNSTTLDVRHIYIEGKIMARNKADYQTYKRKLIEVFNPRSRGTYERTAGGKKYFIECVVELAPYISPTIRNDKSADFQLSLLCPNPYWRGAVMQAVEIVTWIGGLRFPLRLPTLFALSGQKKINVRNNGDVETPVRIDIQGPATNPKIENLTTGEHIEVKQIINAGEVLTITTDYGAKRVELEGVNKYNYITSDTVFFSLEKGDNIIEYTSTDVEEVAKVKISYYNRFVGV